MHDHDRDQPIGPTPRRRRRGEWMLLAAVLVIWGIATGSPLMRPKDATAGFAPQQIRAATDRPNQSAEKSDLKEPQDDATQRAPANQHTK